MTQRVTTATATKEAANQIAAAKQKFNVKVSQKNGRWEVSWDIIPLNKIKKI